VDSFTYLGLSLSKKSGNNDFYDEKFRKVEKAFYSLYGLGCKPRHLNPISIGFIYKQYCQSILRYGLECLYLPEYKLHEYNVKQNVMLKQAIGLSKYTLSTPLLNVLRVEKIEEIYIKHKLYFFKQIMSNMLTRDVFLFLKEFYPRNKAPQESYNRQIELVDRRIGFAVTLETCNLALSIISKKFSCRNLGLIDSIYFFFSMMDS